MLSSKSPVCKRLDSIIRIRIIPFTEIPQFSIPTPSQQRKKEQERTKNYRRVPSSEILTRRTLNSSSSSILRNFVEIHHRGEKRELEIHRPYPDPLSLERFVPRDGHDPEMVRGRRRSPKWSGEPWIPSSGLGCVAAPGDHAPNLLK